MSAYSTTGSSLSKLRNDKSLTRYIQHRATLLLAHSPTQIQNQKRLESYLATSAWPTSDDDLMRRLSTASSHSSQTITAYRRPSPIKRKRDYASGATTPRNLNSRVRILELYTLHVLPRNNEWDYSRDFISLSPVLDEERREAFLQALQSLREDCEEQAKLEREHREREADMLKNRLDKERRRAGESETLGGRERDKRSSPPRHVTRGEERASPTRRIPGPSSSSRSRATRASPTPTLATRAGLLLDGVRSALDHLASQPMLLARLLAFVAALVFFLSRRGVRERLLRARYLLVRVLAAWWAKILATAGMGVKMSKV